MCTTSSDILSPFHTGLTFTQDSTTKHILVKSVKGAIRKDGRIRVGDQILAINQDKLENISIAKANKILKKASSKSEGVTLSYLPAPLAQLSSTPYGAKSEKPPVVLTQQSQHFSNQSLPPNIQGGRTSLHDVNKQESFAGGQAQNVGMAPSHPTIIPPQMVPQGPPQMSQWTYPLGPGATISPMQPTPFNYQLSQQPQQTYGQPLAPLVWQVQQPGSLQLPVGQPPQQVAFILREPPNYADLIPHHMVSGTPFNLSQTGPVSVPSLLPSQPPPPTSQPASLIPTQPQPQPPLPPGPVTQTAAMPRMTKAQSEIKLQSGVVTKPEYERRHKSQSGASPRHPPHPYKVYRRRQQQQAQAAAAAAAAALRVQQTLVEEPSEPENPPKSHDRSHDYSRRLHNMSRDLTHDNESGTQQQLRNSVDREVEENPALRKEFPNVEGILFEVWLKKGKSGLGMSIAANRDAEPRGIVIMGIQSGGVADRSNVIMWGDMILKINDTCVIGMTQQEVQEMLMKAASHVRFVMLRQAGGKGVQRTVSAIVGHGLLAGCDLHLEAL